MNLELAANLAVIAAIFIGGFAVDPRVRSGPKLEVLPWPLQLLVGGVAIAPILFFEGELAIGAIDGLVVGLAVSVTLWIVLPAVLTRVIDAESTEAHSGC